LIPKSLKATTFLVDHNFKDLILRVLLVFAPFVEGAITLLKHVGRSMEFHHIFRKISILDMPIVTPRIFGPRHYA
jgi:hypothetical protein